MRLRILSDLHQEHFPGGRELPEEDADVVILAGDIHEHLQGLHWAREAFPDTQIVYVAGNHEFYNADLPELTQAMRNLARALDIHFLENDAVVLGNVRVLGATLWTDFQLYGERSAELAIEQAQLLMPDFSCVDYFTQPFTPSMSRDLCEASCEWLAAELSQPFAGRTVVVTHHAPSGRSIPAHYVGDSLSPAFASNLEHLAERCDLWVHGHVHERLDYRIGNARIVTNPGAYPGEDSGFDPRLVIEL
ncbi:metallophosphoesterase [Pseudomonas sp. ZM23]|uniref:Metallophosphoesterase n=1 Tax=Pseudomonas triclosanedens TaxID=2961893 RepID=A0ABY6ZW45_9PSED|nr:metallophosphoesterase family protein [Pseudomonas triclosanedens]MCP8467434.1 metallophosphoesterase [Pseudomonas triclosanedens]MCP8469866.1 metallophosphoesterase [Pseudomonas triclosanedens]MCP8478823.1 metallophosphoesterase [Pseudomonas triclosanedens]WAI49197.1 metallophosphoesterase [Pseudomonas triclosanedens]